MPSHPPHAHPVPRHSQNVLATWADALSRQLGRPAESIVAHGLSVHDFAAAQGDLRIQLMDGSFVQFCHAFHLVDETQAAIAVFTEHCGYHVFPFHGAVVTRIKVEHVYDQEG